MKPSLLLSTLAVSAASALTAPAALLLTEIQSDGLADFWELTNTGSSTVDLGNWKWDDDSQNPADSAAVTIPSGTTIAPGESIVFVVSGTTASAFRSNWGIPSTVHVITGGPGLGGDDGIALFNASNVKQFFFTYKSGSYTLTSGSTNTLGGQAGASAGGGTAKALVWDPASGDTSPRYTYATGSNFGTFAASSSSSNVGSPGYSGYTVPPAQSAPAITTQPSGSTISPGGTATLTVAASGTPAPTFQWYIGESGDTTTPVSGATGATLATPALTATTRYWARATNVVNHADSASATITVSSSVTSVNLSNYVRVGRYALPEPLRTSLPPGTPSSNYLCQEASGVTYNWDTDTLFIVGDGGRAVTQVSKTGVLIDTMSLPLGGSSQGTEFYDTEGITYLGNGEFAFAEERDRRIVKFTYAPGTTLTRAAAKTVTLGTYVNNTGLEGFSYDPQTGGFIVVKEISPMGIFQTNIDFDAGTATNGSPGTVDSVNLFNPSLLGTTDFGDVFALSNLPDLSGQPQAGNLLVLSQESARILNTDRAGNIASSLQIQTEVSDTLSSAEMQHEGITMDRAGNIYIVNENGGGDIDHPELWVYAPSTTPNQAPSAVAITNPTSVLPESTNTTTAVKVGNIVITDDGLGTNALSLTGADAAHFEIVQSALYLKAGTTLDYETKTTYNVTVRVDDATLGSTPDVTTDFTLAITDVTNEVPAVPTVFISEVHPTGSSGSYSADWIEITNAGTTDLNISGWTMDDDSDGAGKVALRGVTTIPAGRSAVFFEGNSTGSTDATILANFCTAWFGTSTPPARLLIGAYGGSGVGLGSGGDHVNVFDSSGNRVAGLTFGSATGGVTFDNRAAVSGTGNSLPTISRKSANGVNGAFVSANGLETGSPGTTGLIFISEVHPTGSSTPTYGADWFELTNATAAPVTITGWTMDDDSDGTGKVALRGLTTIPAGKSAVFFEGNSSGSTDATILANFCTAWFGTATPPAGFLIGAYGGSGVGFGSGGDRVNVFDASGNRVTGVAFGSATSNVTFDNKAGLGGTLTLPPITAKSANGVNGAFVSTSGTETGSPGVTGRVVVTEVAPWSSGTSLGADWFEVMNGSAVTMPLTGWKMDDSTESPIAAVPLNGITSLEPGERAIFIETSAPSTTVPDFRTLWFGSNPPAALQIGSYTGDGVGLGTSGDAVNLYDGSGVRQSGVSFGASPSGDTLGTFENPAGTTFSALTSLSTPGVNGAFVARNASAQVGSPGTVSNSGPLDFSLWLHVHNLTSAGFSADSNGNGAKDGVDYFFNVKKPGDLANLPKLTSVSGEMRLTFSTLDGASGITGVLEHSGDLGATDPWAQGIQGTDYEVVSTTSANGQTTTTLRLIGSAAMKFWRYRVTQ